MKTLAVFLFCATTALGGLKWETAEAVLDVHPLQGVAPVAFNYSNPGSEPVVITDVTASCGCLVPERKYTPIPPGGKGSLKVQFDLFGRTGPQHKTLSVKTSDGATKQLSIRVDIPKAYTVAPVLMKLMQTGPSTKTAVLKNSSSLSLPIQSAESSNPAIKAELLCIKPGFEYKVLVTPLDTNQNHRAVIRITPETPEGMSEVKNFKFYVVASKHDPSAQK
ncbi:DUF1573 domain-containing protein [Pontiellaceae bacterium B12227]|nr:DUF1573 domain-containing protein [Pontiellaceae bacterium B12227]